MRIAPHSVVANDQLDLTQRVVRDGLSTHGHPRALVGALVFAFALAHSLSSEETLAFGDLIGASTEGLVDPQVVVNMLPADWGTDEDIDIFAMSWAKTNDEMRILLDAAESSLTRGALSNPEETLRALGCVNPQINGAGTVSAAGAIYIASRFAARPIGGLVTGAFLKRGDTDTLASMAGSLFGSLHGGAWLGSLATRVQDAEYIRSVADSLARDQFIPSVAPTRRPSVIRALMHRELPLGTVSSGEFPDGRHFELIDQTDLATASMIRFRLKLNGGQTVVVDSRRERSASASASASASEGKVSGVTLATENLSRCAAFYAKLLGRDIPVIDGKAEISEILTLRQSENGALSKSRVLIDVKVDSIVEVRARLGITMDSDDGRVLKTRDPDGRYLFIESLERFS